MTGRINTEEARQLHAQGMSDSDIARHFGVTQSGATRWRQRQGLQPNILPMSGPRNDPERRRRIRKMLREGATMEQVVSAIGCNKKTVARYRKEIASDDRLRGLGVTLKGARNSARRDAAEILAELTAATSRMADATIRDDAIGEMFLAMMEGRLERQDITTEARRYCGRQVKLWQSPWGPASIDEELTEDGLRLIDLLPCPHAAAWLESAGA